MPDQLIPVTLSADESGMVGRQCPDTDCGRYFKVRFGTGLDTSEMSCPYCGQTGEFAEFLTEDQREYVLSVAMKKVVEPALRGFGRQIETLNRASRGSPLQIRFELKRPSFPIRYYTEEELETETTCDNCGLVFSIFGIFASCPDCGDINAFHVFRASLENCRKRLSLIGKGHGEEDGEIAELILQDSLVAPVRSLDALGKALRKHHPGVFPKRPDNLFQNCQALDRTLRDKMGRGIEDRLGKDGSRDLTTLLQVRHILEHNAGVVDERFVRCAPHLGHLFGRKYPLGVRDAERLFELIGALVDSVEEDL